MKRNLQQELFSQRRFKARKVARAISPRGYHHVILNSQRPILRLYHQLIKKILKQTQLRYGIELKSVAIMDTHVHLVIRVPNRTTFAHFLRVLAGQVALRIGRGKLWTKRAWSRVVTWGRELRRVVAYVEANPVVAGIFDEVDVVSIRCGILRL